MKKEINTKTIILIVVSILCVIGSFFLIKLTLKPKEKKNEFKIEGIEITKNKDIIKDTKVGELDVTKPILYNNNNTTTFTATLENNTEKDIKINKLYIIFTINENEEKLLLYENKEIKKQTTLPINITFDRDFLNTTKIEYVLEDQ